MERSDNSPIITCDAPGYIVTELLRRMGMMVGPNEMELPEEAEEGES